MSEAVVVALITGAFALAGTIAAQLIIAHANNKELYAKLDKQSELADAKLEARLDRAQAVTDTKLDELTREVREHNNFARRMPVVEEQIKAANHRIEDLERKVMV